VSDVGCRVKEAKRILYQTIVFLIDKIGLLQNIEKKQIDEIKKIFQRSVLEMKCRLVLVNFPSTF